MDCRTALLTVLDQVDYTNGACHFTEMVGAVLPKEVIALARKAIAEEGSLTQRAADGAVGSAKTETEVKELVARTIKRINRPRRR